MTDHAFLSRLNCRIPNPETGTTAGKVSPSSGRFKVVSRNLGHESTAVLTSAETPRREDRTNGTLQRFSFAPRQSRRASSR
jgi:hypothetical protein